MDQELAGRLEKIETHLAHLERTCDELNQVIVAQAKELAHARSLQQRLSRTLEAIELERVKSTNPKPPHYG